MAHRFSSRLAGTPTSRTSWRSSAQSSYSSLVGGCSPLCRPIASDSGGRVGTTMSAKFINSCTNFVVHRPSASNIRPDHIIFGIRSASSSSPPSSVHAYYVSANHSKRHHPQRQQPQPQPRGKYLDMKECNSIEEVCDMAYPRLHELNPRNLSSIWTKVSQIIVASNYSSRIGGQQHHQQQQQQQHLREQLESIFTKTTDSMMTFEPRDLTQTALSFAKIVREVVAGSSSNHHNSNMMNSKNFRVGGAGVYYEILHDIFIGPNSVHRCKEGIFQSIADAAIPNIWYFEPRFLSNLAYANAIAGTVPVVATEDGSTTTTTTPPTLFDRIAEVSIPLLAEFNPQDLSNIVWSYEKVRATTSPLFDEVANSILARDDLDRFPPQALSNILLAFAKVHESNNNPKTAGGGGGDAIAGEANTNSQKLVFEKVADHIITTHAHDTTYLDTYTPQALANILWAYATVHECSPALFETVAHHILHHHHHRVHNNNNNTNNSYLTSFKAQELSNIVWAYASTSNRQPLLFSIVADHILLTTTTILKSFNAQNCGNILWAYATANIIHEELFARVSRHVMHNIDFASLDGTVQYNLLRASEKAQRVVQGKKKKKEGALEEGK